MSALTVDRLGSYTVTIDLDGTEVEVSAINGRLYFNGEEVSEPKMQALQDAIHNARVNAAMQEQNQ